MYFIRYSIRRLGFLHEAVKLVRMRHTPTLQHAQEAILKVQAFVFVFRRDCHTRVNSSSRKVIQRSKRVELSEAHMHMILPIKLYTKA